jgi:hypothetical protein
MANIMNVQPCLCGVDHFINVNVSKVILNISIAPLTFQMATSLILSCYDPRGCHAESETSSESVSASSSLSGPVRISFNGRFFESPVITIRETGYNMLVLVNRQVHGTWQWTDKVFVFKGHDAMIDLVDSNYAEGWVAPLSKLKPDILD